MALIDTMTPPTPTPRPPREARRARLAGTVLVATGACIVAGGVLVLLLALMAAR